MRQLQINTRWAGRMVFCYETVDSTNLLAKQAAEDGASQGTLVIADCQTAGRGRRGRQWSSPPGVNVYMSLILKPDYVPERASMVTLVMGLAVAESVRAVCGVETGIKWPNDIVVNGKKVCGILTEMSMEQGIIRHMIVGVGINVGQQEFAPEIAETATSLVQECGREVSKTELVAKVMETFEECYEIYERDGNLEGLLERYNGLLINKGREVRVLDPQEEFQGRALGINETGELLVERCDKTVAKVYAGEVSVRGIYGYV